MNKRIYCVLLSVLIPFSIHPTRHNYDIPEEWDTVLQEHLAAARMQPARAQRIAELLGIFFRIAAVEESPEVSLTQKLSMVANVRDVLLDGLNQDLVDLRHQVHTHPDDALAQETLTALYPFTACVRSFTFKNKRLNVLNKLKNSSSQFTTHAPSPSGVRTMRTLLKRL